jgi:predicted transcriptional regulator
MSQDSVLKYLKKQRKWKTTKEVSKSIRVSCAFHSLKKLLNQGEIIRKESYSNGRKIYLWSIK